MTLKTELWLVWQVNLLGNRMVEIDFRLGHAAWADHVLELEAEREVLASKRYAIQRQLFRERVYNGGVKIATL